MVSEVNSSSFEKLLSRLILKEEINEIGQYVRGKDIDQHLASFLKKFKEMEVSDEKRKAQIFKKTLSEEVLMEISALPDFHKNESDFEWLSSTIKDLFSARKSAITPYIDLLNVKQLPNQSTKEFLSSVRINGMRILSEKLPAEREALLIMTFVNGLRNKKITKILQELHPKTLQEAFTLIKSESVEDANEDCINLINNQQTEQCSSYCKQQIADLQRKLLELEQRMESFSRKIPSNNTQLINRPSPFPRQPNFTSGGIRCYNCNLTGHVARHCRKAVQCRNCGKSGHISQNCRSQRVNTRPNLRNIDEELNSQSEVATVDVELQGKSAFEYVENTDNLMSNNFVCSIQKSNNKIKSKVYPKQINNWSQFINGQGGKPKEFDNVTKISHTNPESARNKPIVSVEIENNGKANVLFDTGCDCNVVDYSFFEKLAKLDKSLKIVPKTSQLTCANGTKLNVIGYTILKFKIESVEIKAKFTIVETIFPKIIIGIKTMIKEKISVNAGMCCLDIKGRMVASFHSVHNKNSGNC